MFDAEDEWLPAVHALIARSRADRELVKFLKNKENKTRPSPEFIENHMILDSDPKPLAALLRSERPIPAGIRDTLAELLDPGNPEYLGCQLRLVCTGKTRKNLRKLEAICGHRHAEERTSFRYKNYWLRLRKRILDH